MGNEVEGVSKEILTLCDHILEIPMQGEKESLNVSVCAGVVMYELLK
jgi:23S rRNA (guanosine2251-2'-O)-methyltransferase